MRVSNGLDLDVGLDIGPNCLQRLSADNKSVLSLSVDFFQKKFFFKIIFFFKNCLRNTIRESNSFDPDQDRHYVKPDLGPNCLQRLSADRWQANS